MRYVLLLAVCTAALVLIPAPPVLEAVTPLTPECECTETQNDFPFGVAGQGGLTESIACTANSPAGHCTAAGNITWSPTVTCCSPASNWSNNTNISFSQDCTASQTFTNCGGAQSNPHSCSSECVSDPGFELGFAAVIQDCNAIRNLLGVAGKKYRCKII
jgi:hypothetical protein